MIFLDNKYTRWYYNIIDHRKKNIFEGYTENHHIIPSCMGGSNKKDNLIRLTAREHFICHLLLVKMTTGREKNKLWYALNHMLISSDNQQRYMPSSRTYSYIKEELSKVMSENNRERWKTTDIRDRMKLGQEIYWQDPKNRDRVSKQFTSMNEKFWNDPEYRATKTQIAKKWNDTQWWTKPEYKELLSETTKKQWQDPEFRRMKIEKCREYSNTEANKKKFVESMQNFWKNPENKKRMSMEATERNKKRWANPDFKRKRIEWCNEILTCDKCQKSMKRITYNRHKNKCNVAF